jgi:signal transduction histidine kinase
LVVVVDRLNELLDRLGVAFAREQGFTSDVAHELRTPLAGLRTTLEVCRGKARNALAYKAALDICLEVVLSMQAIVESLFLLARADNGQLTLALRPFDLPLLLKECWTVFAKPAEARSLRVTWDLPPALVVASDREKLQMVVQNLFDNAVSYVEDGGVIEIQVTRSSPMVEINITNSGSHMQTADIPFLFQRFWRRDQQRSETGRHAGLGLSISMQLMNLIHGKIEARALPDRFFQVRLQIPEIPPGESPTTRAGNQSP